MKRNPFTVLTNLGRKEWNNWSNFPVQFRGHRENLAGIWDTCSTVDTCRDTTFSDEHRGLQVMFLRTTQYLPLLEPEIRFRKQAQFRHECRIAAIEVEANAKISKSLIGKYRPMCGDHTVYYRGSRSRSPSVASAT